MPTKVKRNRYRIATRVNMRTGELTEKAAKQQGLSVYTFVRNALLKELISLGYLDKNTAHIMEESLQVDEPKPKKTRPTSKK